jgi:hypothetical protein
MLAVLPSDAKLLAWFVAGLEPRDRRLPVINGTWPELWRRLGRPAAPPGPGPLLDTLAAATLSAVTVTGHNDEHAGPTAPDRAYLLHPVVVAAIRRETPADVRDAIDSELGAYWRETVGRAALAALPYLTRRRNWDGAASLLDDAIRHGALLAGGEGRYLPELRLVSGSTAGPGGVRGTGARHTAHGSGRSPPPSGGESRQRRLWGRLLPRLARLERNEQVLVEMTGVRDRMRRPMEADTSGELPGIVPWAVREDILGTGRGCALAFRKWQEALDIGAEILDSQRRRGAARPELTRTRFFNAYPLIRLRRLTEAAELLMGCQRVFEDDGNTGMLSHVFTERADLADALGHADDAVRFARSALRMTYTRTIPDPIATAHQRLARYLGEVGGPPEEQQAHWLAAAIVYRLGGLDRALDDLMLTMPRSLRADRGSRQPDIADPPPRTLADVIDAAEQTSGVHLAELITAMEPDADTVARTLTAILDSAAGQGRAAAVARASGRQLFTNLGGYELAADPGVASLVNRFRRWLGPSAGQNQAGQEQGAGRRRPVICPGSASRRAASALLCAAAQQYARGATTACRRADEPAGHSRMSHDSVVDPLPRVPLGCGTRGGGENGLVPFTGGEHEASADRASSAGPRGDPRGFLRDQPGWRARRARKL